MTDDLGTQMRSDAEPDLDDSVAARALRERGVTHDFTFLPREFDSSGLALYDDSVIEIVKEIRGLGADAAMAYSPDDRSFIGEKSAAVATAFVVGLASTAAWDLLKRFVLTRPADRLSVKVFELKRANGTIVRRYKFDGSGTDVARAIDQIRDEPGEDGHQENGPSGDQDA